MPDPRQMSYRDALIRWTAGGFPSQMGLAAAKERLGEVNRDRDILSLARNLEAEAGNQGRSGKEAVANTVLNRMDRRKKSAYDTVWEPMQYSWTNDPKSALYKRIMALGRGSKDSGFRESYEVAKDVLQSGKPVDTGGTLKAVLEADHYLNPDKLGKLPSWAGKMKKVGVVGDHHFFDSKRKPGTGLSPTGKLKPGAL